MNKKEQNRKAILKLYSGEYSIQEREDGYVDLTVEGIGMEVEPGKPRMPGYTYHAELPKGVKINDIQVNVLDSLEIEGQYRIPPANAIIHDRPGTTEERTKYISDAKDLRDRNSEEIYSSDKLFPKLSVNHIGTWAERKRTFVLLRYNPFQYRPKSGVLIWNNEVEVEIEYSLADNQDTSSGPLKLVSAGELFTIPDNLFTATPVPLSDTTSQPGFFNYVIIVPDNSLIKETVDFVRWKERIGHSVAVVTLEDITRRYGGIDDAERLRNFLIHKFDKWAIHFVLLVGDMDAIPTRLLYANEEQGAYASDFYYANLSTVDWDLDNDDRWGEFDHDQFNYRYDVIVGRLPLNAASDINDYFVNAISFEQDTGAWKKSALFAAGFMDHDPTDGAELAEYIDSRILKPDGWTIKKLYENAGTVVTKYQGYLDLGQGIYVSECRSQQPALISLTAHGHWDFMRSWQCSDPPGKCNSNNDVANDFGERGGIQGNFFSAVVYMNGCSTACPVNNYQHVEPQPGTPASVPTRSLFNFQPQHPHNGIRYLERGAVAVIGSSAGVDYAHQWKNMYDGYCWSLKAYFFSVLRQYRKSVGETFFRSMLMHAVRHNDLKRGVRDFYYMGDPSLILEGVVCDNEARQDVIIHRGHAFHYAACNDKNGDLYVAVTSGVDTPSKIIVYRSTDHGRSWTPWYNHQQDEFIHTTELLVNRCDVMGFQEDHLLIFYTTLINGNVYVLRVPLGGGNGQKIPVPLQSNASKSLLSFLSVTQDSLDGQSSIYLAYSFRDQGYNVKSVLGISDNNGLSWRGWTVFDDYYRPAVQVGPNNMLYFAGAFDDPPEYPIHVRRSDDLGATWYPRHHLTAGDIAVDHLGQWGPSIAVSSDPAYPCVWVSYYRGYDSKFGANTEDIGYAYSLNDGKNWERDLTLSVGSGPLSECRLKGYSAAQNRNINAVYASSIPGSINSGKNTNKIFTRSVSAEQPATWSPAHIMNHEEASIWPPPLLVNSPGAPASGTGIVYLGAGGVLFSAPWI